METESVGKQIRKYRKLKGLTQEELAKRCGLSTISIRRYEAGERIAPQPTLIKIAEALDIHLWDLTDGSIWSELHKVIDTEELSKDVREIRENYGFKSYLESLDYIVEMKPTGYSVEDCSYEISGNGLKGVILSSKEYKQMQSSSGDLIYSFLWKKQQK